MISLEGGCTGCSATPMTAMQIYYSLMKLDEVQDVIFVNGELPAYMRSFIDDKLNGENQRMILFSLRLFSLFDEDLFHLGHLFL